MQLNALETANFTNTIIFGNENPEILLDKNNDAAFNFKFTNCLIKFSDPNNNFNTEEYDFDNTNYYENIIVNEDPEFLDPLLNLLQIPNNSPADGKASVFGNLSADIIGTNRGTPPDLGAYESILFPEEEE